MTLLEKIGNRCSLSYDIGLDAVIVPDEARIGPVGGGFDCLKKTLFYARSGLASAVVGTAQAAVDTAANHARERTIRPAYWPVSSSCTPVGQNANRGGFGASHYPRAGPGD